MSEERFPPLQGGHPWMDDDEVEVLRSFVGNGVRFVVIGGRAVQFYGHRRKAKDLDLFVERSPENWLKLQAALLPLNSTVVDYDQLSPDRKYQEKLDFYPTVEFLTDVSDVPFTDAWVDCSLTLVDGLVIRVISKSHLIRSKQGSSRPTDLADIDALQRTN
jgi:hypothetical protein